jgi:hypothetical protein
MSVPDLPWKRLLDQRLPALGHRNWIGVVDAAYPLQSAAGLETVVTEADHLTVLREVLAAVDQAPHVRARVLLDAELEHLPESHAAGIGRLRDELKKLLAGQAVTVLPHEEIIGKLDGAARLFNIVLFKTTLTLPYTSVFLELDCGYWSEAAEHFLRDTLKNK